MTAVEQGATLVNYCPGVRFSRTRTAWSRRRVARDLESGEEFEIQARTVINATGCFSDGVRRMADARPRRWSRPARASTWCSRLLPARGTAIMVPHTSDGRVMFAIPWHGHALVGHHRYARSTRLAGTGSLRAGDRLHPRNRRASTSPSRRAAPTSSAPGQASVRW